MHYLVDLQVVVERIDLVAQLVVEMNLVAVVCLLELVVAETHLFELEIHFVGLV